MPTPYEQAKLERIALDVQEIMRECGIEYSEGTAETPIRVAKMYQEIFSGIGQDPYEVMKTFDQDDISVQNSGMVIVRDIPFYSVCEHHLLPFFGTVTIGYIPSKQVLGLSKLSRVVDILSRRPQVQERLTSHIAEVIRKGALASGVIVSATARHMCVEMRGVRKPNSETVTYAETGYVTQGDRNHFLSVTHS